MPIVAFRAALFAAGLGALATLPLAAQPQAQPSGPSGYEIVSRDANVLEIRFHNMPLKGVHADASQNALALDFQNGIDGTAFDRLAAQAPDWVSLAYANYDTGVIRAARPVTFLTRSEPDGFSLRMVARGPAPMPAPMVEAPPGPVALRGPIDGGAPRGPAPGAMAPGYGPPPPSLFARYDSYGALRSYAGLELAVNRADPTWERTYRQAAVESDSEAAMGTEYHSYHTGDTVIASHAHARIALAGGLSIIGSLDDTDAGADTTRAPDGSIAANFHTNLFTGAGGVAFDSGPDTELTLEALAGNGVTGARFTGYTGDPDSYWQLALSYHQSDLDTPEAILGGAFKDQAVFATGQHLGYGVWVSLAGHGTNYGMHGDASVDKTAGWDANLRWSADLGPLLAGLSYDGHGDYLVDHDNATGAAPTPYVPLSLRNMENHSATASLSSLLWGDELWLDIYGGYIVDRYASSDGGIYGAAIRYRPAPGVDIALGARHSAVSLMQGETGNETSAGLTFTLGFDGPRSDFF